MVRERDSRATGKPTGRRTADSLTGTGNDAHLILSGRDTSFDVLLIYLLGMGGIP